MEVRKLLFLWSLLLSTNIIFTASADTLYPNQLMRHGETLVSADGSFELGFFSPGSSKNIYLGIQYKNKASGTKVWIANRESPLNDTSGVLKLTSQGILVLLNHTEGIIWSSNSSRNMENPVAELLDSGNLVVRDGNDSNPANFPWQSFDYPSDTLLPGMKFGKNVITGLDWYLSSWKSPDDPDQGDFTFGIDPTGYPQFFIRNRGVVKMRFGPWNGLNFSGMPNLKPNQIFTFGFVFNQEEIYYSYKLINDSVITRLVLSPSGQIQRFVWISETEGWMVYTTPQTDNCDTYALCGPFGSCNVDNSPPCQCLKGFEPKYRGEWDVAGWSNGCYRRSELKCGEGDSFLLRSSLKLPDTRYVWFNASMSLEDCRLMCLKNCTCTAYANMDIRNGESGCFLWFGDLMDTKEYAKGGQDLYVKVAASELDLNIGHSSRIGLRWRIIIGLASVGVFLPALGLTLWLWTKKRQHQISKEGKVRHDREGCNNESQKEDLELHVFDFATLLQATDNFSADNKIGQGGFGPVYKGVLEDGKEIAVKTLSKNSKQGIDEFKNEVLYIARLQHRNLVKLLGYCFQEEEKILIYEYMANKSLDLFIFDKAQRFLLDWPKCLRIIQGIARGLLYLHQDSRLRIIHRDLKVSNILLDSEMNPKISDFGMARSFGGNESQANTDRVVGTFGYMSPEYAIDGLFSIKSDVFSFGVLVLEIVSGKRNRGFRHPDHDLNLLGHAWKLYEEGRSLELMDESMDGTNYLSALQRVIQVGLLCVQQCPEARPDMEAVVLMLGGEGSLPQPKQPGFFTERSMPEANLSHN
ncbi:Non-specific serine/threonine protein kinase [Bertholletia excelsa]